MANPGAHHASGQFKKVVPVRLRPGTDVMDGLKRVCEEHGIKQGAILMGIGSLCQLSFQVLTPSGRRSLALPTPNRRWFRGPWKFSACRA